MFMDADEFICKDYTKAFEFIWQGWSYDSLITGH